MRLNTKSNKKMNTCFKYSQKIVAFLFLLFFSLNGKAQEGIRVIDNKGTIKNINKVTISNTKPTEPKPTKGDVWFDQYPSPNSIEIFDGTQWRKININGKVSYTDIITATKNKIGELKNGSNTTDVNETVTIITQATGNVDAKVTSNEAKTIATYKNEKGDEKTINETITKIEQPTPTSKKKADNSHGHIEYKNETANTAKKIQIVSKDPGNELQVGTDGGGISQEELSLPMEK